MNLEEHAQECNNALSDLIGKEIHRYRIQTSR